MFLFLTVLQAIIAAALVGVILMQRSEGGGLGVGGNPSGLMSARGAADILTRATAVLAVVFVGLSIALAIIAVGENSGDSIDQTLDRSGGAEVAAPASDDPLDAAGSSDGAAVPAPAESGDSTDPLDAAGE
ncbi:preprotein translocase subunit SecG [Sphingorhabdus sp. Alg239-R122]|uniref:preprotein translocase subunit SecG n=1 Tax=Sphingorhabdus sp. Alg239-R122 TaxID=2305989 RepID=UPI0013DA307B|nr:preprotein translocase subunit SecG [Sphingorhabdus sp. Alg239-R122]